MRRMPVSMCKQVFYLDEPWTPNQTGFTILHELDTIELMVQVFDHSGYQVMPVINIERRDLIRLEFKELLIDQYSGKTEWRSLNPYITWPVRVILAG